MYIILIIIIATVWRHTDIMLGMEVISWYYNIIMIAYYLSVLIIIELFGHAWRYYNNIIMIVCCVHVEPFGHGADLFVYKYFVFGHGSESDLLVCIIIH